MFAANLEWALASTHLERRDAEARLNAGTFVAYYRVSTPQQGRSGLGLDAQRATVRTFVARRGARIAAEHVEVENGRKCDRAELRKALVECRVTGATLLIATFDRLARNVAFIAMLIESGADFIAADFPLANSFEKHVLAAAAEDEVKTMSNRRKAVCVVMKARGFKFCRHLDGLRVHRPENLAAAKAALLNRATGRARALAPLLCELRDAGRSIHGIAEQLTRMEIEPPAGGLKWHSSSVRRLFALAGEDPPRTRRTGGGAARQRMEPAEGPHADTRTVRRASATTMAVGSAPDASQQTVAP
jgi:DNA invertase Pin-like site-specific DNA recombinase